MAVDVRSKIGSFAIWNVKFVTTVVFSDGFCYKTYKTDREDALFRVWRRRYTISTLPGSIVCDAEEAHRIACEELLLKGHLVCESKKNKDA